MYLGSYGEAKESTPASKAETQAKTRENISVWQAEKKDAFGIYTIAL